MLDMRPSRPGRGRRRGAVTSNFMDLSVEDTVDHEMNGVNELDEVVERVQGTYLLRRSR